MTQRDSDPARPGAPDVPPGPDVPAGPDAAAGPGPETEAPGRRWPPGNIRLALPRRIRVSRPGRIDLKRPHWLAPHWLAPRWLAGLPRRVPWRFGRPRRPRWPPAWFTGPWPLSRITAAGAAVTALVAVLAVVVGSLALAGLSDARDRLVLKLDPATFQALRLDTALVNQETGVRGYALSAQQDFLTPYTQGLTSQADAAAGLRTLLTGDQAAEAILAQVRRRAGAWRARYAEPTITLIRTTGKPSIGGTNQGKAAFDSVRRAVAVLQTHIAAQRARGEADLHHASQVLVGVCIAIAVVLMIIVVVLAVGLRAAAIRPLSRLAAQARQVAGGDFGHEVEHTGPSEVRELGADVNRMRERILHELSALQATHADLETRSRDLQRSNSELEQFAYVASHDLQEPLRKVASFCQLLQRRYADQLDERANQYIDLAVDGAKRMQALITDLLSFSRVGRGGGRMTRVSLAAALGQAMANLSTDIEATGARIEVGALPVVLGEESLLTAVFQNLLSNALKFRGPEPPHVAVAAARSGLSAAGASHERAGSDGAGAGGPVPDVTSWLVTVSDNGIGIASEFAERIFVIFQRLHGRDMYPGTGIGLAMCRKIIEYHGGRIWLDTSAESGSCLRFTLPVLLEVGAKNA